MDNSTLRAIKNFPKNAAYAADYAGRRMEAKRAGGMGYVESAQDKMAADDKKKRLAARDKALAERTTKARVQAEVNYQQDKAYGKYHYAPSNNSAKDEVVGRRGAHLLRRSG